MEKSNIETSRRSRKPKKPKKSQIPFAILLFLGLVAFGIYLYNGENQKVILGWMFGLAFGFVLQRSRFCFTAAFRDPSISGSTSITRAVLVAIGLATIGFAGVKYAMPELALQGVSPIGLPLILGGVIFGTGMVIAGGCASGTLMRVGEGFTMQMISLFFFVVGSLIGVSWQGTTDMINEKYSVEVYLPDIFGMVGSLFIQGLIIVLLYIAARKWQEKKMGTPD